MNCKALFVGIIKRIPSLAILATSFYLSSKQTVEMMPSFWNADKLVHCFCFAGLTGAWTFWFSSKSWNQKFWRNFVICVAIVSFYGVLDEFHQSFVPGRQVSIFDWLADTIGAVFGSFAGGFLMKKLFCHTKLDSVPLSKGE